ncbi:efflux RND transporter periplasmic adaptor subunit [Fangia hongkongensis]|uniref:efflux RND transporter periplasmic adaptor subunit n=1 Tax=Fangia hongkongensis TaxID=270495 RepID=UPI0003692CFE|nr:efflux RND transporter periplasmic adaptor subunit [Fangia hongkongensis]MBK2124232.1 efflux RND transporter periplasmic adaptor subunit [Fangia hongkongensis]
MKKRLQAVISIIIILIFIAIVLLMWHQASEQKSIRITKPHVATMTVKTQSHDNTINALGHIESVNGITIKSNVAGPITKINVTSGEYVTKGQTLIEINPDALKANLAYYQAQTQLDKLNLTRYQSLYKQAATSKAELDTAQATYQKDLAEEKLIQSELNDAIIHAPFSGNVGIISAKVGQYVSAGDDLLSLQTFDPVYVDFSIPSKYQAALQLKQKVELAIDAYPDKIFTGYVSAINNQINPDSNSILVRANFSNKDKELLPGDLANINLVTKEQKNLVIVPSQAVVYDGTKTYVYKIVDDKAYEQPVTLGNQVGDNEVILTNGIHLKDIIVIAGTNKLRNGINVSI